MSWDTIQGNWIQFKGKVIETWGRITHDEVEIANGRREQLAGLLKKHYGLSDEQIEQELINFESGLHCCD
jgi:uncharacterized protein YjbJ (UPF0337 family)